jgi:hypothetical protein
LARKPDQGSVKDPKLGHSPFLEASASHFLIAQEIVDDLESALEQFRRIANDLGSDNSEKVT